MTSKRLVNHVVGFMFAVPIGALLFAGEGGIDGRSLTSGVILAGVGTLVSALFSTGKRATTEKRTSS